MPITTVDLRKAVEIARGYGATKLILFGSYLENPETARDLDLAVDGVQGWKLYELAARIERALHVPLPTADRVGRTTEEQDPWQFTKWVRPS